MIAAAAHARLAHELAELADTGRTWPCATDPERWYSTDAYERAGAARLCLACPALKLCGFYADAAGERWGVWGGRDRQSTGESDLDNDELIVYGVALNRNQKQETR